MLANTLLAQGGYWLAGILTVVAAAIVTILILVSSLPKHDQLG